MAVRERIKDTLQCFFSPAGALWRLFIYFIVSDTRMPHPKHVQKASESDAWLVSMQRSSGSTLSLSKALLYPASHIEPRHLSEEAHLHHLYSCFWSIHMLVAVRSAYTLISTAEHQYLSPWIQHQTLEIYINIHIITLFRNDVTHSQ